MSTSDVFARTCSVIESTILEASGPLSESEIIKIIKKRKQVATPALRALYRDKKILRKGSGNKGAPYLYFATITKSSTQPDEIEHFSRMFCDQDRLSNGYITEFNEDEISILAKFFQLLSSWEQESKNKSLAQIH